MEQLPVEPDERVRPIAPERVVRGRDSRVRRPLRQSAQDGAVRVQPLLPEPVL